jgi:reverse gyrase
VSTLVICESPGKIKNIQKYLGSGYIVTASVGHIFDLPEKELGIDIKNNFKPTFAPKKDKKEVLNNILSLAKKSDSVILLTDPDREGEEISEEDLSSALERFLKREKAELVLELDNYLKIITIYEVKAESNALLGLKNKLLKILKEHTHTQR